MSHFFSLSFRELTVVFAWVNRSLIKHNFEQNAAYVLHSHRQKCCSYIDACYASRYFVSPSFGCCLFFVQVQFFLKALSTWTIQQSPLNTDVSEVSRKTLAAVWSVRTLAFHSLAHQLEAIGFVWVFFSFFIPIFFSSSFSFISSFFLSLAYLFPFLFPFVLYYNSLAFRFFARTHPLLWTPNTHDLTPDCSRLDY